MKNQAYNTYLGALTLLAALLVPLPAASAQPPSDREDLYSQQPPAGRQRGKMMRHPDMIRKRIQQLEARLDELLVENPEDPRIAKMEQRLERLRGLLERAEQAEQWEGERPRGKADAQPKRHRGKRGKGAYPPHEIQEFIEAHPELARLFETRADGSPANAEDKRRMLHRNQPKIEKIMRAFEHKDEELAGHLIASAEIQFELMHHVWRMRHAKLSLEEKNGAQAQLAELVRKQVEQQLFIRELEIRKLEQRLERQRRELHESRMNIDELAEREMERLLSAKGPREQRRRRGFKRPGRQRPAHADRPAPDDGEL